MEFVSVIEKKLVFFGFLGFKFSLHHIYLVKSYTTYFKPRR